MAQLVSTKPVMSKEWVTLREAIRRSRLEGLVVPTRKTLDTWHKQHPNGEGDWWTNDSKGRIVYNLSFFRGELKRESSHRTVDATKVRINPKLVPDERLFRYFEDRYAPGVTLSKELVEPSGPNVTEKDRENYRVQREAFNESQAAKVDAAMSIRFAKLEGGLRGAKEMIAKRTMTRRLAGHEKRVDVVDRQLRGLYPIIDVPHSMSETQAAAFLGFANAKRLERLRKSGEGPLSFTMTTTLKRQRVMYLTHDLGQWVAINPDMLQNPDDAKRIPIMLGFGPLNLDHVRQQPVFIRVATVHRAKVPIPVPLEEAIAMQPKRWGVGLTTCMPLHEWLMVMANLRATAAGDGPLVRRLENKALVWLAEQLPEERSRLQPSLSAWAECLRDFEASRERHRRLDEAWKDA